MTGPAGGRSPGLPAELEAKVGRWGTAPVSWPDPAGALQGRSWWRFPQDKPFSPLKWLCHSGGNGRIGSVGWEGSITWTVTLPAGKAGASFHGVSQPLDPFQLLPVILKGANPSSSHQAPVPPLPTQAGDSSESKKTVEGPAVHSPRRGCRGEPGASCCHLNFVPFQPPESQCCAGHGTLPSGGRINSGSRGASSVTPKKPAKPHSSHRPVCQSGHLQDTGMGFSIILKSLPGAL